MNSLIIHSRFFARCSIGSPWCAFCSKTHENNWYARVAPAQYNVIFWSKQIIYAQQINRPTTWCSFDQKLVILKCYFPLRQLEWFGVDILRLLFNLVTPYEKQWKIYKISITLLSISNEFMFLNMCRHPLGYPNLLVLDNGALSHTHDYRPSLVYWNLFATLLRQNHRRTRL